MGSSLNKDPTIQIFLTLSKRVYYAGETLEGVVHIDCKALRTYSRLFIRIRGSENVHWQVEQDKRTVHYTNSRDTYDEVLSLVQFSPIIKTGQYSFPFSLLLPSSLPASYVLNSDNFIKYVISAQLHGSDQETHTQAFEKLLHIREPSRLPHRTFSFSQIGEAKFCYCCCVCGEALLSLQTNSVSVMQGQNFHVRAKVDNTHGSMHIKGLRIYLYQISREISSQGRVNGRKESYLLYEGVHQIPIGNSYFIDTDLQIPNTVSGYTAIGNILSRAYYLCVLGQVNCFFSSPHVYRQIILNNTIQPQLNDSETVHPPLGWNPNMTPPAVLPNLKPYIYMPANEIDVRNQIGVATNLIAMNQISSAIIMQ